MKKLIKLGLHIFSLSAVAVLVFFTNIVEKIPGLDKKISSDSDLTFGNPALADVPASSSAIERVGSGGDSAGIDYRLRNAGNNRCANRSSGGGPLGGCGSDDSGGGGDDDDDDDDS